MDLAGIWTVSDKAHKLALPPHKEAAELTRWDPAEIHQKLSDYDDHQGQARNSRRNKLWAMAEDMGIQTRNQSGHKKAMGQILREMTRKFMKNPTLFGRVYGELQQHRAQPVDVVEEETGELAAQQERHRLELDALRQELEGAGDPVRLRQLQDQHEAERAEIVSQLERERESSVRLGSEKQTAEVELHICTT